MGSLIALVPVLLQLIEQGVALAPELIAEIKSIFASLDPSATTLTAAQEQAIWDALTKVNAQVQAAP